MTGPSPDRSGETPWSELEKSFFASAPPDVPQPAPEPMRFDDLAPIETAKPEDVASFRREIPTGIRRAVNAATATRDAVKQVIGGAGRRVRPALASVKGGAAAIASAAARGSKSAFAATARGSKAALAAARGASVRTVGAGRRLGAVFAARRSFAVAVAIALVATGISVGVVASRDGAGPTQIASTTPAPAPAMTAPAPAITAPAPAITAPAPVEPPPPVATPGPTVIAQAPPAEPEPAPVSIAPSAPPPAPAARPSAPAAEPRPAQAAAPKRPARPHRRQPTYSARNDLIIPSFMTASPRQEVFSRPAPAPTPAPSNRPFFSR